MITLKVKMLRSLKEKSTGIIGVKDVFPVYFTTRWGIHTFGVLSPIDVLILDDNNRVVKLAQRLLPNHIFMWSPKYKHVVELPTEEISEKRIALGDLIQLLF